MTTTANKLGTTTIRRTSRPRWPRIVLHLFLISLSLVWLFPLLWTVYTAFRPYSDTAGPGGYVSIAKTLTLDNFTSAWTEAQLPLHFFNTLVVAVPGVILTLFISSMLGFAFSRFRFRFNMALLMMFTAGNLLPPQVIIVPLYRLYLLLPIPKPLSDNGLLYDQFIGLILIHVVFQTGFATFVLSNYMRTLSKELVEAAVVDGASVWTIYRKIVLPLCRPALAALATLEFTFIYNDFFWALMLMKSGAKRPVTAGLNDLQGAFFTDNNQLAAAALLVALPTIVLYLVLSKQFVRGLTLGSTKG